MERVDIRSILHNYRELTDSFLSLNMKNRSMSVPACRGEWMKIYYDGGIRGREVMPDPCGHPRHWLI